MKSMPVLPCVVYSLLEQKVDQLAEMMAEVIRRLPKDEEEGEPATEGD